MIRPLIALALGVCLLVPAPSHVQAQTRPALAADAALNSRYVWRGITRRNDWVVQPDVVAGVIWGRGSFSVGGWTNYELSRAEPASDEIGLGKRFGEWDVWAQFEYRMTALSVSLGYMRYFVDQEAAAAVGTALYDTSELYLGLWWRFGSFEPRATLWWDVGDVDGAYAEFSAAYRVPVFPVAIPSLYLQMLYGFSFGQALNEDDPAEGAYFVDNGLTHIEFSAETQISVPGPLKGLYLTPSLHFQVNRDLVTKRITRSQIDATRGSKWWAGVAFSWFR